MAIEKLYDVRVIQPHSVWIQVSAKSVDEAWRKAEKEGNNVLIVKKHYRVNSTPKTKRK